MAKQANPTANLRVRNDEHELKNILMEYDVPEVTPEAVGQEAARISAAHSRQISPRANWRRRMRGHVFLLVVVIITALVFYHFWW